MKTSIKIVLTFFPAVIVGYGAMVLHNRDNKENPSQSKLSLEEPNHIRLSDTSATIINDTITSTTVSLPIPKPVVNTSKVQVSLVVGYVSYSYSVRGIKVEGEGGNYLYTLYDDVNKYTSEDGTFRKVQANTTGSYFLTVENVDNRIVSEPIELKGFNKQIPIENKVSARELTEMIGTGDWDGNRVKLQGRMRNQITINCSDPEFEKKTIQEVFMAVLLEGWLVEVTDVSYDSLGKLYAITLKASK